MKHIMKPLSETYKELGIAFSFPIEIKEEKGSTTYCEDSAGNWIKREYDANGKKTYHEDSNGYWWKWECDASGNETYYENSNGYWVKREYDACSNQTYFENSDGDKKGTPRSDQTCEGKVVEVDGVKYELKSL